MKAVALSYPTDLSEDQWDLIAGLLPSAKQGGRPRQVSLRAVVNAIFYLVAAGCSWRLLPHDFPKWKTVYHYFRQWRLDGTWQRLHERLLQWVRVQAERHPHPSAASLDTQSVKTGVLGCLAVGFDGGKWVKGRKRHLMVDTLGLVLMVVVTAANVSDPQGARLVFARLSQVAQLMQRLVVIWVDGTYAGVDLMQWTMNTYRWVLQTIKRSDTSKGFVLLPKRWVVERTWGWLNWSRRLSKDYEILPATSETMIYIALIRIMLKRLA